MKKIMNELEFKPVNILFLTETVTDESLLQKLYERCNGHKPVYHTHPLNKVKNVVKVLDNVGEQPQFFITVYPDEISAFRYIGEKKGFLDKIGFYRVEDKEGELIVHDDGCDVEEIFKSLNKALDYIAEFS